MWSRGWLALPGVGWWRGPLGVRAGWRAGLYLLLVGVVLTGLVVLLRHLRPPWLQLHGAPDAWFIAINEVLVLLPVVVATGVMAWLEGVSPLRFGLCGRGALPRLAFGALAGVALLSALILLLELTGHAVVSGRGLGFGLAWRGGLAWAGACLLTGLAEETACRGYLQWALARGLGFWPAALITSLIFALLHTPNPGEGYIGVINVFGAGMILCLGLRHTGTLFWSIGFHAGWDWSENFLFGTHDSGSAMAGALLDTVPRGAALLSGGATGPEGSLYSLALEALCFLLLTLAFRRWID